jgi:uncharacterized protein (UPF0216 family)
LTPPIDRIIEHEIDSINDHMPVTRHTVNELLQSDSPQYLTRGGEISILKKDEIAEIAEEVPSQFHKDVRLPIVILRRMDYGPGIYSVAGEKAELFLLHRILGYVDLQWTDFLTWKPVEKLMRPQVQAVRRRFPSTTCIGFITTVDDD